MKNIYALLEEIIDIKWVDKESLSLTAPFQANGRDMASEVKNADRWTIFAS